MTASSIEALRTALGEKETDPFMTGDVVRWSNGDGRWTYVALKTGAGWFTTAQRDNPFVPWRMDYEELLEILAKADSASVEVASGWETV